MAPARRGGLVIALRDGIYRARTWGGDLRCWRRPSDDTATMRFNDGKCDASGRFWAGTLHEPKTERSAALYCLDARGGSVRACAHGGRCDHRQRSCFLARRAHAVLGRHRGARGARLGLGERGQQLSNPRVFRRFDAEAGRLAPGVPYQGRPDGATVDAEGGYWAAMFEGAQLLRLAPGGGLCSRRCRCRSSARPCPASAATTCARCSSPAPGAAARPTKWRACPPRAM